NDEVQSVALTARTMVWILCGALAVIQAAIAVPIALAWHDIRLALPIAAMGAIYLASPPCAVQTAFLQREGRIARIATTGAVQVVTDNLLTAVLALCGLGFWAIVLPKLLVAPIWPLGIRAGYHWHADRWSLHGWRDIARFSRSVLGIELLGAVQANIDYLIVGMFLGVQALGTYYFAFNAGLGISLGLVNAFGLAVFPYLCAVRQEPAELARRYRRTCQILGWIVVPLVLAQAALAPIYVPLVFGVKWAPAVPVLAMICLSALARPFALVCSQLLKAAGRPEIELRWQCATTAALIIGLVAGTVYGILGVAVAVLLVQSAFLSAFVFRASRAILRDRPVAR
ncbi:MAG: oligosaccharide flippase family protein, partial [Proteobacteria bacterium]|nr:oligosaccharide flippase family protein [Pseudomonadota bacterium]